MISPVSDVRSNDQDNIDHAVKVLGRSKQRLAVFENLHKSRQKVKTATQIARETGLTRKCVLAHGKSLVHEFIVKQTERDREIAYEREGFYYRHRRQIVGLVHHPKKRRNFATKYSPRIAASGLIRVYIPSARVRTATITIDSLDSFAKVRRIKKEVGTTRMLEGWFKQGFQKIIGERGKFKDWGGESSDLFTTRLRFKNARRAAAIAFKGRGKLGPLTPAKMGKNGDQIQRLFTEDAEIFLIQYHAEISASVVNQMAQFAQNKSLATGKKIYYGIIDGNDSARLVGAYPRAFKSRKR